MRIGNETGSFGYERLYQIFIQWWTGIGGVEIFSELQYKLKKSSNPLPINDV